MLLATAAAGSVAGSYLAERAVQALGPARSLLLTIPGGALLVGIPAITTRPFLVGVGFFAGGGCDHHLERRRAVLPAADHA